MAAARKCDDPPNGRSDGGVGGIIEPWVIEKSPDGLLDNPLEFIFAEHYRQRAAAAILTMIADGEFDERGVKLLINFLETDFDIHIGDEELALFPMLKQHCLPEDKVERVIERLQDEHREDEASNEIIISILKSMTGANNLSDNEKRRLRVFAEHIRQHLALENGVLLPIARVRLGPAELNVLVQLLKDRRR